MSQTHENPKKRKAEEQAQSDQTKQPKSSAPPTQAHYEDAARQLSAELLREQKTSSIHSTAIDPRMTRKLVNIIHHLREHYYPGQSTIPKDKIRAKLLDSYHKYAGHIKRQYRQKLSTETPEHLEALLDLFVAGPLSFDNDPRKLQRAGYSFLQTEEFRVLSAIRFIYNFKQSSRLPSVAETLVLVLTAIEQATPEDYGRKVSADYDEFEKAPFDPEDLPNIDSLELTRDELFNNDLYKVLANIGSATSNLGTEQILLPLIKVLDRRHRLVDLSSFQTFALPAEKAKITSRELLDLLAGIETSSSDAEAQLARPTPQQTSVRLSIPAAKTCYDQNKLLVIAHSLRVRYFPDDSFTKISFQEICSRLYTSHFIQTQNSCRTAITCNSSSDDLAPLLDYLGYAGKSLGFGTYPNTPGHSYLRWHPFQVLRGINSIFTHVSTGPHLFTPVQILSLVITAINHAQVEDYQGQQCQGKDISHIKQELHSRLRTVLAKIGSGQLNTETGQIEPLNREEACILLFKVLNKYHVLADLSLAEIAPTVVGQSTSASSSQATAAVTTTAISQASSSSSSASFWLAPTATQPPASSAPAADPSIKAEPTQVQAASR